MNQNTAHQVPLPSHNDADVKLADSILVTDAAKVRLITSRRLQWCAALLIICCLSVWTISRYFRESLLELNAECRKLNYEEDWNRLGQVATRWSDREPQIADPWLYRAAAAEGSQDWIAMVQDLDHVPQTDKRAVGALVRKAALEFETLNRPWDGVRTCDELLQLDPRVLIAHKQTIFFFAMTLQRAEMVRRIRQAIHVRRESPESYVYLVSASWLYNRSLYRHNTRWLESDPDNEVFQVAQALQVYTSNAKTDTEHSAEFEHIPPAEELLAKYPHNLEMVAYFVNRSITEGELDRVRELLNAVSSRIADEDSRLLRAKAWCDDADGHLELAEQSLRKAYSIDPYWWQVHFQLYDVLRRQGRVEESQKFFEIYQKSKDLSIEIMTINKSVESLDSKDFCRSMLELAELIGDDDVIAVLKERV